MYRKLIFSIFVFLALIISATVYFTTSLKIVSAWVETDEEHIVLPNKTWNITFSDDMSKTSLKESFITVTNENGDRVKVSLHYDKEKKTVAVRPPKNGYPSKMKYELYIDRRVKSVSGKELRKNRRIVFFVKETLPVVASKDELNKHFLTLLLNQKKALNVNSGRESIVMEQSKEAKSESNDSGLNSYSETNNQVQGVDEADNIKTDGTHIYQVLDGKVRIVKAFPASQMEVTSTITYEEGFYPNEIFLHKNQLIVIGYGLTDFKTKQKVASMDRMMVPIFQSTKAIIYDISNPAKPQILREVEVEGSLVQARKKAGIVYLISNYFPDLWQLEKNKEAEVRPRYRDSIEKSEFKYIDYNSIQYLPESKESNYTMITTINLEQVEQKININTYIGSGRQLYMSDNHIYLAVLNEPFIQTVQEQNNTTNTSIYKFTVNSMDIEFNSSADVAGTVLNQFSMDEHEGYFRVATTEGFAWNEEQPSANHLFILDQNLLEVGKLEDLARGERIYSARFMGDRIYIVTFKETDPLFVIDAKNPAQPKVMGELKIPGFSNYLHPYDENHLIGFGHDTKLVTNKGSSQPSILTNGVKISLFDVSDIANPREKFTEIIGGRGTYSPLNYDHKALLFQKELNIMAFPISVYTTKEGHEDQQTYEFQGGIVYKLDLTKGFQLQKKITHMSEKAVYEEWENSVQRMIFIEDQIYSISPNKLTSHSMKDFIKTGEISLQ
jgi:inhibitor of cysteine peptidase